MLQHFICHNSLSMDTLNNILIKISFNMLQCNKNWNLPNQLCICPLLLMQLFLLDLINNSFALVISIHSSFNSTVWFFVHCRNPNHRFSSIWFSIWLQNANLFILLVAMIKNLNTKHCVYNSWPRSDFDLTMIMKIKWDKTGRFSIGGEFSFFS